MKKFFLCIISVFLLTACGNLLIGVPTKVRIDGTVYKTGFYGEELWPVNLSFTGEEYQVGRTNFCMMDWKPFDCVQAPIGMKTGGTIYCLADQWEDAKAYYENPENYRYYCLMNSKYAQEDEKKAYEIEDIDLEKYEALIHRGSTFGYEPFDIVKNKAAEYGTVDFDTLKIDPKPYFTFYKESKDEHFTSTKKYHFFILDGTLYLARYYNMSEHTLSAVEIPAEMAEYFIEIAESFADPP